MLKSFIDFSSKISIKTHSLLYLNRKNNNSYKLIAENSGFHTENFAVPEQIHSSEVKYIDIPGNYCAVDGLITDNPKIILTLKVADCVPIFLFMPSSKVIGLIHSGWRGTTKGIILNTIKTICNMGENIKNIHIFLGPSIGFCCYEVGEEVADFFNKKAKKKLDNGRWHVGLKEEIYIQLTKIGIPIKNIKSSNICTFESPHFHSYRRDGADSGRMIAFMGMK